MKFFTLLGYLSYLALFGAATWWAAHNLDVWDYTLAYVGVCAFTAITITVWKAWQE